MMFETQLRRHKFVKGLHLFQESPKLYEEPLGVGSPLLETTIYSQNFPNFGGKSTGLLKKYTCQQGTYNLCHSFDLGSKLFFSFGPRSIKIHALPIKLQTISQKNTSSTSTSYDVYYLLKMAKSGRPSTQ